MSGLIRRVLTEVVGLLLMAGLPAACASTPAVLPTTVMIPLLTTVPQLDGQVETDGGWTGASRINLSPNTYVLLGRAKDPMLNNQDCVFFSVVCRDFAPTPNARVVLGLITSMNPPCDWKLHFTPFPILPPQSVTQVEYWRDRTNWNAGGGSSIQPVAPGWPSANSVVWAQGGANNLWSLECRIPYAPANQPGSNDGVLFPALNSWFLMYIDVLNTPVVGGGTTQLAWPMNSIMSGDIRTHTPPLSSWGNAKLQ